MIRKFWCLTFLIFQGCHALTLDTEKQAYITEQNAIDQQKLKQAYVEAQKTYIELNRQVEHCRVGKTVPVELLKKLNLTVIQWRQALPYLSGQADQQCFGVAQAKAESALMRYFWLEKTLIGSNQRPVDIPAHGKTSSMLLDHTYVTEFLFSDMDFYVKAENYFLKLPLDIQKRLKQTPEFQTPFDWRGIHTFIDSLEQSPDIK